MHSMTAFARQATQGPWGQLVWEIRSVNHRYLELTWRLPEVLRQLEPDLRAMAQTQIKRGKLECHLRFQPGEDSGVSIQVNQAMLEGLTQALQTTEASVANSAPIDTVRLLSWPGVVTVDTAPAPELIQSVKDSFTEALTILVANRQREGQAIQSMLLERLEGIVVNVEQVRAKLPELLPAIRESILERCQALKIEADPQRLEQELVFIAQKTDVSEECDRLDVHVKEMRSVLQRQEPIGRRCDFLLQEFQREANTLSSKINDITVTQAAVDIKVLVEQFREQIQNIE